MFILFPMNVLSSFRMKSININKACGYYLKHNAFPLKYAPKRLKWKFHSLFFNCSKEKAFSFSSIWNGTPRWSVSFINQEQKISCMRWGELDNSENLNRAWFVTGFFFSIFEKSEMIECFQSMWWWLLLSILLLKCKGSRTKNLVLYFFIFVTCKLSSQ